MIRQQKSLEDVLRKLVGDLYQPSFERMSAKLDSVALSLIQSYAIVSDTEAVCARPALRALVCVFAC